MRLMKEISWAIVGFIFLTLLVIIFVQFPRNIEYIGVGNAVKGTYVFSWEQYRDNLHFFFKELIYERNLGQTFFERPVEVEAVEYALKSLPLIAISLFLSIPLGIAKGVMDLRHSNRKTNFLGNGTTAFFQSVPDFMVIICVQWGLMELMSWGLPRFSVYMDDEWYSFILPSLLLTLFPAAYLARITSMALGSQEEQLYILFARAKGLSERVVLWKHMLRNCWPAILNHLPSIVSVTLSNLLIVEYLTQYRGAAFRLYQALGYHNSAAINVIYPGKEVVSENNLIIVIVTLFMFLILLTKIASLISRYFLDPLWREEK